VTLPSRDSIVAAALDLAGPGKRRTKEKSRG
jgi:hypothetical protein